MDWSTFVTFVEGKAEEYEWVVVADGRSLCISFPEGGENVVTEVRARCSQVSEFFFDGENTAFIVG